MRNVEEIIKKMTLEEKASLLGGDDFWHTKAVDRLDIPHFMVSDGPHGLRKQEQEGDHLGINDSIKAVCFPAACATASSFDVNLLEHIGEVVGEECQAEDVAVVLGPAVNIKRSPLCGRNFEYFSEDPYLAGKLAASYINGVQSKNVGTSIKHFALNNQETRRMSISSDADLRTINEIYFPAFETAVKEAQPKSVMCSYNKINGTYAADNEWLLSEVLRKKWGFKGFVVTDWGAVNDRVQGVKAGLDLEMPGNTKNNDAKIVAAVRNGKLREDKVDEVCKNILSALFNYYDNRDESAVFDREKDHLVAVNVETECAVLLENNGVLPLKGNENVLYIGEFADKPRYQGGGSSHINSYRVDSALESANSKGRNVSYMKGFSATDESLSDTEIKNIITEAKKADVVVVFAGLSDLVESEGYDRNCMKLPECQNIMIQKIAEVNKNLVVVLHNGSPIEVPWANDCAAILEMYLGGEGVGEATDRLLYGEANPSGHLAESFPIKLEDNPSYLNFPGGVKSVEYNEGIFVGYRYYDTKKMPVRWAFGHGLSYTKFEILNIETNKEKMSNDETLTVSVDVINSGNREGKEVVQLYISDLTNQVKRPVKELKGFCKVNLKPQEKKKVSFQINTRDLSYFEERIDDFYAYSGKYQILIGNSSDNIKAEKTIEFINKEILPLEVSGDTTIGELLSNPNAMKVIEHLTKRFSTNQSLAQSDNGEGLGASQDAMTQAMFQYMPLKSLQSFLPISDQDMDEIIEMFKKM